MRVITGKYKGQTLNGYTIDGTRPTMDRVKESLCASIQDYIKNSTVLDLFAGTGAIGIELLSMGAKKAYFVDKNKIAIKTIKENISKLKIQEETIIINDDFKNALKNIKEKIDIIFLDPPYNDNLINECLILIDKYDLLNENGIIICEYENELFDTSSFKLIKEKKYGSKNIKIYKK